MLPLAVRSQQPCGAVSQAAGSVWNYLTSVKNATNAVSQHCKLWLISQ